MTLNDWLLARLKWHGQQKLEIYSSLAEIWGLKWCVFEFKKYKV